MVVDEARRIVERENLRYVRDSLVTLLQSNGAMNACRIADILVVGTEVVVTILEDLVRNGSVEVMRPISLSRAEDVPASPCSDPELEYYRWIRKTDEDYIWQAMLAREKARPAPSLERKLALLMEY